MRPCRLSALAASLLALAAVVAGVRDRGRTERGAELPRQAGGAPGRGRPRLRRRGPRRPQDRLARLGPAVAAGVGTAFANDCSPDCAAGHFHTYRAVLLLSGSQSCGGKTAYRTATVAIVGTPPPAWQTAADATYPLRCAA